MPTAAFTTLGCKVNQYETQRILESFENAGFGIVPFESHADVYVINTCSVTSIAESKSRYAIRRATRHNGAAKVVVTGCAAQMAVNKEEEIEGADLIVPNPEKLETFAHFARNFPDLVSNAMAQPTPIAPPPGRTRATLKVQDGCNAMCSYCSIPYTRPGMVSRPAPQIVEEALKLAALGYREIVLTGVLIGSYGPETGSGGPDFEDLIRHLANRLEGQVRLRISSIELNQVTDRLLELVTEGKVVPHLHIPLQSGDDGVLKDMARHYSQREYIARCQEIQKRIPGVSLSTDILVGFPTEDENRFQSSVHVCEEVGFIKAHVFRFSPRWGTPADRFGDPIPNEEKQRRSAVLSEVAARTRQVHCERFLGRTLRVLVEGKTLPIGVLEGLTDNYIEVRFTGPSALQRSFANVRLDEVRAGTAFGELAA